MIAVGIDPGLHRIGMALVDVVGSERRLVSADVVTTPPTIALETRWQMIFKVFSALVSQGNVGVLGIEDQHGAWVGSAKRGKTNAAARRALECVGLFRSWALDRAIPVVLVSPKDVKITVLGRGASRAGKAQVLRGLRAHVRGIPLGPIPDHASDAIGVALAASARHDFDVAVERATTH